MTRLPRPTGKELVAVLERAGFEVIRSKGSHHFLRHSDGRATVVPVHARETIGTGLIHRILKDCGIAPEEFRRLLSRR